MMRYGLSGTWRSFTTAGGGPAAGHAWERAPPPQPPSAMTMPLSTTTLVGAATCMGYLPLSETASSDGAPRASQSPNAVASCARRHSSKIDSAMARTPPSLGPAARHCSYSHCSNRSGSGSAATARSSRSEEHTSELQSRRDLVCRLLLEKKKSNVGGGEW